MDDFDVTAFDQSALNKRILQRLVDWSKRVAEDEPPDPDGATWRRCRGERDGGCRAAENRDEFRRLIGYLARAPRHPIDYRCRNADAREEITCHDPPFDARSAVPCPSRPAVVFPRREGIMDFAGPGKPLTEAVLDEAAAIVDIPNSGMWAVIHVESSGGGYQPDRRPKILFERHKFSHATGGRFDDDHPDISDPVPGGYGEGGAHQYDRLAEALALDRKAALASASWGLGQVLGSNFEVAGFADVEDMIAKMVQSERTSSWACSTSSTATISAAT